jgi:Rieske 2Fe-2S family protein
MNSDIENLIEKQSVGYSLGQAFYNSPQIFELDFDRVLSRQWQFVDHVSRLPNPGDFITYQIANESIIIIRDMQGELRAHFNVCRHRGSRLCAEAHGNTNKLVCPYHAWVYALDGSLKSARQMADDFKPEDHGLHPCRLRTLEGLIFINLNEADNTCFDHLAESTLSFLKPHGLPKAKIAHTEKYNVDANWKLVVENFRECYHCTPSHPEYTEVNAYVRAGDKKIGGYLQTLDAWKERSSGTGMEAGYMNDPYSLQPHYGWRMPIKEGFRTSTQDGTAAAPLMGDFKEYDGAETGVFIGALSYFYLNNDYATTFRITPKSHNSTEVEINWLVDVNAVEDVDYDVEKLKWLWHVTTVQDQKIVNENQIGVNSSRYSPGPYSLREYGTADFTAWYLARLQGKQDLRVIFRK